MTAINPARTKILLIGCSQYNDSKLPPIPQIKNNIADLAKLFRDTNITGVKQENVTEILDPKSRDDVIRAIGSASTEATDTLVIYYAGHGMIGLKKPNLYLAVPTTPGDAPDDLGIDFDETIRSNMRRSRARKRILILDCCYSGRAAQWMGDGGLVHANVSSIIAEGAYVLTASGANQLATFGNHPKYTDFTGELIRILREGVEEGPEFITTEILYNEICGVFKKRKGMPDPQQLVISQGGKIAIAVNVRWEVAETDCLPEQADRLSVGTAPVRLKRLAESEARHLSSVIVRLTADAAVFMTLGRDRLTRLWTRASAWVRVPYAIEKNAVIDTIATVSILPLWAFSTVSAAIAAAAGVGWAMLRSAGWSYTALDPFVSDRWERIDWSAKSVEYISSGPLGNLWIALLLGAIAGSQQLVSVDDYGDAKKVSVIRRRLWNKTRLRDPLVKFAFKWWLWRAVKTVPELFVVASGGALGALIGGDVSESNAGIKVGATIGIALAARSPYAVVYAGCLAAVSLLIPCILWVVTNVLSWFFKLDVTFGPIGIWYDVVWSVLAVFTAVSLTLYFAYIPDFKSTVEDFRWLRRLWLPARICIFLAALGFWYPRFADQVARLDASAGPIASVAFVPNDLMPIAGTDWGALVAWPTLGAPGVVFPDEKRSQIWCVVVSSDGKTVFAGCGRVTDQDDERWAKKAEDCTIKIWSIPAERGQLLSGQFAGKMRKLNGHTRPVYGIALSTTDPNLLFSVSGDGIRRWNLEAGEQSQIYSNDSSFCCELSRDGKRLVVGKLDGVIKVYDAYGMHDVASKELRGHASLVRSVGWSHDGSRIVSGGADGTVRVWDAQSGKQLEVFNASKKEIYSVAFAPSGRWVVSGGQDDIVRLWDLASSRNLYSLDGHVLGANLVAISPNEDRILASDGISARLWRIPEYEAMVKLAK